MNKNNVLLYSFKFVENMEALLTDLKRMQVDSATMAVDVNILWLTVDEYKWLRTEDAEMITPYIQLRGLIEDERLKGEIRVPVTLHQAVWIEYKRRWIFWKRVRAVHQTISSDNPYVEIRYSEYISFEK